MANFLAELKRRHIYRVATAYAVVAWVLLQLFNNLAPLMKLPDWAGTLVLVLLAGAFPVTLIFAWVHELKASAGGDAAATQAKTTRLDFVLAGALVVVIALVSYQQLAPSRVAPAAQKTAVTSASLPAQAAQAANSGISIAVLPFVNLSGDANQEFFSDGMTEEITTALTKVSALRVVGRESAFQFKGQKADMRTVGQALGANYLIEGSVRKAGDRVRISAQLTRADNGVNLWADNYDRQLTDIFATQEDIAQAIAIALKVPLGLALGERLVSDRTDNAESYDQYLRARALFRARGTGIHESIPILEKLTAQDHDYAPAWALLADAYTIAPQFDQALWSGPIEDARKSVGAWLQKAEAAAQTAIQVDARYAGGYAALGRVQDSRGKWIQSEDLYRHALTLDPNDPTVLETYGTMLFDVGRFEDSRRIRARLQALEPLVLLYKRDVAGLLFFTGRYQEGVTAYEALPPEFRGITMARLYAAVGRFGAAADAIIALPRDGQYTQRGVEDAARLIRDAPKKLTGPRPELEGSLNFVYAYIGEPDRFLAMSERNLKIGYFTYVVTWGPEFRSLTKSERYKAVLRSVGVVDYWRARGWPDFCHPVGTDDFECN